MKNASLMITCVAASVAALLVAVRPARADTVVVTADRMIDVIAGRVVERPSITIVDGRITAVGTQGAGGHVAGVSDAARHIDLAGMTLLPGLIDMHTHITGDPSL